MIISIFNEAQFTDNPNAAQIVRIYTSATLAQVQAAGWLNNAEAQAYVLSPKNLYEVSYNSGANVALFTLAVTNNVYTLSLAYAINAGTTVVGDLASFSNTSGGLADSGILATNVVVKNAVNQMAAGAGVLLDKGTGTVSTGAVTINKQSGVITGTFTTAAAATDTVTFNNSEVTSTSVILVSLMGGTNVIPGVQLSCAYTSAGVATLSVTNNNVAGSALSGTLIIGFVVL